MSQWSTLSLSERKQLAQEWVTQGHKYGLYIIVHVFTESLPDAIGNVTSISNSKILQNTHKQLEPMQLHAYLLTILQHLIWILLSSFSLKLQTQLLYLSSITIFLVIFIASNSLTNTRLYWCFS